MAAMIRRILAALLLSGTAAATFAAPTQAQVRADGLEVVLAIDTSGSMWPAMGAAKAAANEFVAAMPPEVRIGVETFGDDVEVLAVPTTDHALLRRQIDTITADGDTTLYDAVVSARELFTPDAEQRVLVVLSDGADDGSDATLDQAIAAVEGVRVESISLTTDATDIASLEALGTVTPVDDLALLLEAFDLVAEEVVEPTVPTTVSTTTSTTTSTSTSTSTTVAATTTEATTTIQPPVGELQDPPVATVQPRPPAPVSSGSSPTGSSPVLWIGSAGIFASLLVVGLMVFPRRRVSRARLGVQKTRSMSDVGQRTMSAVEEALERHGKRADLATALAVAGVSMRSGEFVAVVAMTGAVAGLVGLLFGGPIVALGVSMLICLGARSFVGHKVTRRRAAFAEQLPDVLQLITTALRSGYGLSQALDSVAEDAEEPARSEFAQVLVESRLGRDLSQAMRALARRMKSEDLDWVVSAIEINSDTGGNLSEVLQNVNATIRERQRLARQVDTLTAEGRLSGRILAVMPFAMVLLQWRTNPDNVELLTRGPGLVAVVIAAILMVVGAWWVHRIVNSIAL